MSTGGPCKEQLAIEEERISEKYAQEEAEAQGNLSKNAVVNSFGDCSKGIATATFPARLFPHQAAENLRKKSKKSRRREDEALVNESPRYLPPGLVGVKWAPVSIIQLPGRVTTEAKGEGFAQETHPKEAGG